ncbi:MAG TPA: M67 family metallopeptidase [Anaerolineales bacterium]|nr:M67 family metallopeptidase [Anaerolineales bacterium]
MKQRLLLSRNHWQEMLESVDRHAPLEACGLLAGKEDRVENVILIRNQAQSPTRFVMEPYEQLQAFAWIDSNELDLLGIFHSHPAGPETASATDIAEAAYEVVHLIWSRNQNGWRARGFWIENGSATEVVLQIVE